MLNIKSLTSKVAVTLFSFFSLAQNSYGQVISNNATDPVNPRDWSVLQTDKTVASYGTPLITRTTGTTTSACLDNTNNIQTQATFSISVPGLGNPVYTWSVVGGIEFVGASTGNTVTVRPKLVPPYGSYLPGKLIVDYTGTTSTTVIVPYTYQDCVCNVGGTTTCTTKSASTSYTVVTPQKGQASVNLVQKFLHTYKIVGPRCIAVGDTLTYSIAPLVSSYLAGDGYKWTQVAPTGGFTKVSNAAYNSLDNSSITAVAGNPIPTSLSVNVGACNQAPSDMKTITFGTKMPKPVAAIAGYGVKNPCLDASISQITLNVTGANTTAIDYKWTSDIANTTVVSGSLTGTTVTLNIGSNSGKIYLQATPKTGIGTYCTVNGPVYDTITINRGFTSAAITGPNGATAVTCVEIGKTYQYSATIGGVAIGSAVSWTLPAGMVYEPASPVQTTSTITVKVTSAVATGSSISGTITAAPGICSGTINGLFNLKTAPSLTAITGPNASATAGIFCATPGTNVNYTATAANYDFITWSSTGGITGGGSNIYSASIPNPFTSGTISAFAVKSGCPNTNPITITVKSNAATGTLSAITPNKTCYNLGIPDDVTLTTDAGYLSYIWTVPTGWTILSGAGTNTVTVRTNGATGTVTAKGVNECQTTVAKSITLTASGIGQPVTITKTSVVGADILSAPNYSGSPLFATYEWFKNGSTTPIAGATGFSLQLPTAGATANSYCVVLTSNSCKTGNVCASSTYNNARIAETTETFGVSAYPNPVDQNVTISFPNATASEVVINIYQQVTGIKLKSVTTTGINYSFDVSAWASGLYAVEAIANGERKITSIVVEH